MKKIRLSKADLISALLCTVVIIPEISVYSKLPDRIVTNFDVYGQPNKYSSKNFAVFGIPLVMTGIQLILCLITNLFHQTDKRDFINRAVRFISPAVLCFAQLSILLYSLGQIKNPTSVICTFTAVLFVIMGNYMPKIRRNMFLGIRTPHTLRNQEIWDKTHRFSGVLFFICGIVMIPFSLVNNYIAVIIIIAVMIIISIVYSEVVYRLVKQAIHE
ncbi:MAG: SdpI family protein [Ruminococcus sp.]|nr:SdpI family protein [Ruminococcus sp.]